MMVSAIDRDFLFTPIEQYLIPAEKVAHVQVGNFAEHAVLILTKSGYSAIPVLDSDNHLRGLISLGMMLERVLGLERIEYDALSDLRVDDVMDVDLPVVRTEDSFQKGLDLLVDHTFLCVVDEDDKFAGILTRRVMLKQFKKYIYTS